MNPFAQTIKEFLDKNEDPKGPFEVPESHWFGVVDEKTCTGCGACEGKHGECSECKGPMTHFMKEGKHIGSTCEKCEPEKFAELTKAIAPPLPKCAACGDTKVVKGELDGKPFEEPCPKCCAAPADDAGFMMQLRTLKGLIEGMRDTFKDVPEKLKLLDEKFAKLEPLLKTLPPEPDGGEKGDEEHHDNPPEKKTPPRLVVVRDDPTPEAEKQAARARIIAIAREVINEAAKQEIDRLKGRVH
jgi:hypothetical protein